MLMTLLRAAEFKKDWRCPVMKHLKGNIQPNTWKNAKRGGQLARCKWGLLLISGFGHSPLYSGLCCCLCSSGSTRWQASKCFHCISFINVLRETFSASNINNMYCFPLLVLPAACDSCVITLLKDLSTIGDELQLIKSQLQNVHASTHTLEQLRHLETRIKDLKVGTYKQKGGFQIKQLRPEPRNLCHLFVNWQGNIHQLLISNTRCWQRWASPVRRQLLFPCCALKENQYLCFLWGLLTLKATSLRFPCSSAFSQDFMSLHYWKTPTFQLPIPKFILKKIIFGWNSRCYICWVWAAIGQPSCQ